MATVHVEQHARKSIAYIAALALLHRIHYVLFGSHCSVLSYTYLVQAIPSPL